jgi:glycerol-3-phosphate dehydrogenase (NAD(P)+)
MPDPDPHAIVVVGAGSWGTALAIHLARAGHPTVLWGRDRAALAAMDAERRNRRYLPRAAFPDALRIGPDLEAALATARDVLVAVPSHAFRETLSALSSRLGADARVAWATKGFEITTGLLPHHVAAELLGTRPTAVLSGPTFASEVAAGLPTALVVASQDPRFGEALAQRLSGPNFRAYRQADVVGVEVGGAVKNVIAIGSGLSDGLGFGANTRVALITRGLAEMMRLGVRLGAVRETFMGLAGLGDLVLTCTDDQSRNRRLGIALASGQSFDAAASAIGQVVEGVPAARAVRQVATRVGVEMPICEQVYRIVHEGHDARASVALLMRRALRAEGD